MPYDFIIVGAGSAGCVLAERLTADGNHNVLLLEAGAHDADPLIHKPKGVDQLRRDPDKLWSFETEAEGDIPAETWRTGRLLGGNSSVNQMLYARGNPADYNAWEQGGMHGWGWGSMSRSFAAIERRTDAGDQGGHGPLAISHSTERTPLTEAVIQAAEHMGIPRVAELHLSDRDGVGYPARTIHKGRRQSAADAFLNPARHRPNIDIETGITVDRVLFEAGRAIGVRARRRGQVLTFLAAREVILAAGAMQSPQILERSGIGDAALLARLGIDVVHHNANVGEHLVEHRLLMMQFRLRLPVGHGMARGWRATLNGARYLLTKGSPMAAGGLDVGAFVRTDPATARPDAEVLMGGYAAGEGAEGHSFALLGYPLMPRSEGSVHIRSPDPDAGAAIRPNYLSDARDQQTSVALFRLMRRWVAQSPLKEMITDELQPGATVQTDADILTSFRRNGLPGLHACGTARMGSAAQGVLDEHLRVRGVEGLRVVDGSMLPTMVSGNPLGPVMAMAWHAAELILDGMRVDA